MIKYSEYLNMQETWVKAGSGVDAVGVHQLDSCSSQDDRVKEVDQRKTNQDVRGRDKRYLNTNFGFYVKEQNKKKPS